MARYYQMTAKQKRALWGIIIITCWIITAALMAA